MKSRSRNSQKTNNPADLLEVKDFLEKHPESSKDDIPEPEIISLEEAPESALAFDPTSSVESIDVVRQLTGFLKDFRKNLTSNQQAVFDARILPVFRGESPPSYKDMEPLLGIKTVTIRQHAFKILADFERAVRKKFPNILESKWIQKSYEFDNSDVLQFISHNGKRFGVCLFDNQWHAVLVDNDYSKDYVPIAEAIISIHVFSGRVTKDCHDLRLKWKLEDFAVIYEVHDS